MYESLSFIVKTYLLSNCCWTQFVIVIWQRGECKLQINLKFWLFTQNWSTLMCCVQFPSPKVIRGPRQCHLFETNTFCNIFTVVYHKKYCNDDDSVQFWTMIIQESEAIRGLLSFGLPLRSNDTTLFSRWKFSFFFFLWCKSDLDRWSLGEQIWPKFGPIPQRVAICIFFRSLEPKYWTLSIKTLNNLHIVKSSQVGHIFTLISID